MSLNVSRRTLPQSPEEPVAWPASMHPVLRRIYAARGIRAAEELDLSMRRLLPVGSLGSVDTAAELLRAHREHSILVIGDFDADGATSTALMLRALRGFGFGAVDFLVPNRFEFGYGLTPQIVALAAERKPQLIVTVDNGVSSNAGVAAARDLGIDVLVTDHHLAGAELPRANVIVNPNVAGNGFASGALAGVGVAFYVLAALFRQMGEAGELPAGAPSPAELLDLVALGTVADVVPLDVNNRILVSQGLARIRAGRCVAGISALLKLAKRTQSELVATDLGFAVAPRLNAAGRLTDMSIGIRCLLADDPAEALALAQQLDALNVERRELESKMQAEALAAVRALRDPVLGSRRAGICLFHAEWHQGIVGLVAGRIKEQMRRPVIAFARIDEHTLRGSARSVAGVHIRDVLDAMAAREPDLIEKFGGHAMAAGLTLAYAHLDRFARAFEREVATALHGATPDTIETDGELTVEELALPTAEALRAGGPWGSAFPEPLFDGAFEIQDARVVGERHLKLSLRAPEGRGRFDAIAFNSIDPTDRKVPQGRVRLIYRLGTNEWQGVRRLQLMVEHWLPIQGAV